MKDEVKIDLGKKLAQFSKIAWKPVTAENDLSLISSKFSGLPYLKENESWPTCPNCSKPMQLFLQLNIRELPRDFKEYLQLDSGLIQMFYCTNSEPMCEMDCDAYLPFSKSKLLRLVKDDNFLINVYPAGVDFFPPKTIVKWEPIIDYPNYAELLELGITLTDIEREALREDHFTPSVGDKLGGWPYWVQNIEYPKCYICNRTMQLVFQMDSKDNIPYMFGDCGCGHITQCPEHKEVLAFAWACC